MTYVLEKCRTITLLPQNIGSGRHISYDYSREQCFLYFSFASAVEVFASCKLNGLRALFRSLLFDTWGGSQSFLVLFGLYLSTLSIVFSRLTSFCLKNEYVYFRWAPWCCFHYYARISRYFKGFFGSLDVAHDAVEGVLSVLIRCRGFGFLLFNLAVSFVLNRFAIYRCVAVGAFCLGIWLILTEVSTCKFIVDMHSRRTIMIQPSLNQQGWIFE